MFTRPEKATNIIVYAFSQKVYYCCFGEKLCISTFVCVFYVINIPLFYLK